MLKVFLVEDESLIREGLRDEIPWEQYGFRFAGEAADGEMALPLIRKTRPDVLITDIKMPFMDGLSLSKVVHMELPKTKIVIISGYDDFEYARQAIEVGVDQYLLKPITRQAMRKTLLEMKEKIESEQEQNDYQAQFQNEMHEYEQFSRRRFFERVLEGELTVREIYDEAAKRSIEIAAPCYNLLLLYLQEKNSGTVEEQMKFMRTQEEILHYFLRHPQYILFRWNVNCYGVLIKGEADQIDKLTEKGMDHVRQICEEHEAYLEWYVAVGNPVERLSVLPECYKQVNHYFAYRFIAPNIHVLGENTLVDYFNTQDEKDFDVVDPAKMDPEIIRDFLVRGSIGEIQEFAESYLMNIREALKSRMFRDYVIMNIRFAVLGFVDSLAGAREEFRGKMNAWQHDMQMKPDQVRDYFVDMLQAAISLRDEDSDNQSKKMLRRALEYIDRNFENETLTLNSVAAEVSGSANYLSTIFSQNMQKTFIEYVTGKRMEKAKKLLRDTDRSSGEIARAVGYKDPHYFSFVFKKTQGISPKEYRAGKKRTT